MTDEAVSPLRRGMIEDMTIRGLAPKTQDGYIRKIKNFAACLGRSPDAAERFIGSHRHADLVVVRTPPAAIAGRKRYWEGIVRARRTGPAANLFEVL